MVLNCGLELVVFLYNLFLFSHDVAVQWKAQGRPELPVSQKYNKNFAAHNS